MTAPEIERIVRKVLDELTGKTQVSGDNPIHFINGCAVPIGVSARHIHLSAFHAEALFGQGYKLTLKQTLMGGQYACGETVTLVGLKLRAIENVRVLGPLRGKTQVEISVTDAVRLGVQPVLRDSGDLAGSAPIAVVGPKGAVYLNEGCIVAARHIHMSVNEAGRLGLADGSLVQVRVENSRGLTMDKVKIRLDPSFDLEMHIDTDEANACGVKTGDTVIIINSRRIVQKG